MEYGLAEISSFLSLAHLREIDKIKTSYLKRVLGVHKSSSSTVALMLTSEKSLTEDLMDKLDLRDEIRGQYLQERADKIEERIQDGYLLGPGFQTDRWRGTNQSNRHLISRLTMHGFHHKICFNTSYHNPTSDCICTCCRESCHDRYHILDCDEIGNFHDVIND